MKNFTKYLVIILSIFINFGVNAEMTKNTIIVIKTTSGNIKLELFDDKAPKTSENFKEYIKSGYFNNIIFHRVIKDFMIQGGGFTKDMQQKETMQPIKNEANNMISNERGTIAMARTNDPHSASAQFFINLKDNKFLDFKSETIQGWGYCVFGKVIEGIEVVDEIAKVSTGSYGPHQDVPDDPIIINEIIIEK
jgi:peptidyl-prolyl cis-trans isomerase B (cyclophilin B)|tara:strand:+ start:756 stop:1334 length:579 start_codon:yes stop_codon:yes gene_type:complete